MPEQPVAPYLDAVVGYGFRGPGRFHVPGHKGGPGADPGLRNALGDRALELDVCQGLHGLDLGPEPTPYRQAEELAAEAHDAGRTWFLTNGATQGNHALCLALGPLGAEVVCQRNAHASVVDGLVLSGGRPRFVVPEVDVDLGIAHGVTPEALAATLDAAPEARSAFLVSPTYYGTCADVAALATVCHERDVALVVDQSWGPHFGFHPDLPPHAIAQGADAMLTSTHKTAGALTQAAMLHVARDGLLSPGALDRAMRLVRSTSPSPLLLVSLDAARRQLALHGEQLLHETLQALGRARETLDRAVGVELLDQAVVGRPGIAAHDPLRLVLDVRGTGGTGVAFTDALRRRYDVVAELATPALAVFIVGIGEPADRLVRLAGDVEEIARELAASPGPPGRALKAPALRGDQEMAVTPREAFLGDAQRVPSADAVGRISCESVAAYPPGIPALLPGERVDAETVAHLKALAAAGGRLHGASDPAFASVHVLAERPSGQVPGRR